jgi:ATP-dependent DNA helicase RecG
MTEQELLNKLNELLLLPHETEWLEFKEARTSFDIEKLGRYFSALSNESNLKEQACGWLVFGVTNGRDVCGTRFREDPAKLDSLKHELARHSGGVTFRDIHIVTVTGERVLMFQIPPAPTGMPVSFKGHWYGRDGESIVALGISELEQIRSQVSTHDWSADICPAATLGDLDPIAVRKARATTFRRKVRISLLQMRLADGRMKSSLIVSA